MPELQEKPQKRQVAVKVRIKDIAEGKYIKQDGWQPNFIESFGGRKISRVNIIGIVVFKSDEENLNYKNFIIDDGSGTISVRSFEKEDKVGEFDVGDMVLVIGRPREYNKEKYIIPEIVKKIDDISWIKVRRMELNNVKEPANNDKIIKNKKVYEEEAERIVEKSGNMLYKLIKKMDSGDGVPIDDIIKNSRQNNAEQKVNNLLENGDIFEVKPGIVKVLE